MDKSLKEKIEIRQKEKMYEEQMKQKNDENGENFNENKNENCDINNNNYNISLLKAEIKIIYIISTLFINNFFYMLKILG